MMALKARAETRTNSRAAVMMTMLVSMLYVGRGVLAVGMLSCEGGCGCCIIRDMVRKCWSVLLEKC